MLRLISQPNCVRSERSSYLACRNTVIACTGSYLSQIRSDWRYQGIYGIRETCWTYLCILCGSNKQSSMHACYILAWTDPFISSIESNQRDYGIRGHDGHVWAHTIWPRHISMHAWTLHFCMPGSITLPDCRDKGMYGILWRGRRPWKEAKASYRGWRPPNSVRVDGLHYDERHVYDQILLYLLREDVAYILLSPELNPNFRWALPNVQLFGGEL